MGYTTIYEEAQASFTEKKSEFIGHIAPVSTADEAVAFINRIKAENRKARHNVYAYVLREGNVSRYSDDGEPQGTGGVPVLDGNKQIWAYRRLCGGDTIFRRNTFGGKRSYKSLFSGLFNGGERCKKNENV